MYKVRLEQRRTFDSYGLEVTYQSCNVKVTNVVLLIVHVFTILSAGTLKNTAG